MRLTRYLKPGQIKLELATRNLSELPEGWSHDRYVWEMKERVLLELIPLFEASGKVVNASKLFTDLYNRERKATTAIGEGVAIPHVRTMQARDFVVAFARSSEGVEFGALDQQPVHLFFGVIAPPYDDRLYLQVYRRLGAIFRNERARELLMKAATEHEVIKHLSDLEALEST